MVPGMRPMPSSELVSMISFLALLLLFFSIDVRARDDSREDPWHKTMFSWVSRAGGVSSAIALAIGWLDLFLPDESTTFHVALIAVPGSIGVACAIILGIEMLFMKPKDRWFSEDGDI